MILKKNFFNVSANMIQRGSCATFQSEKNFKVKLNKGVLFRAKTSIIHGNISPHFDPPQQKLFLHLKGIEYKRKPHNDYYFVFVTSVVNVCFQGEKKLHSLKFNLKMQFTHIPVMKRLFLLLPLCPVKPGGCKLMFFVVFFCCCFFVQNLPLKF